MVPKHNNAETEATPADQTPEPNEVDMSLPTKEAGSEMNLEALRLPQDYTQMMATAKSQLNVPIAKPSRQLWFQVHPENAWRGNYAVLELKEERESYIVAPNLREDLMGEWQPKQLVGCVSRQGTFFLWPIRIPSPDGRLDTWSDSAQKIVNGYAGQWIRVTADMQAGGYSVMTPLHTFPAPVWPVEGFQALVKRAFQGRIIDKEEHPIVQRLRGLA